MNIAMWSGPRNLSTAMMYAFGARQDCAAWDEPFYSAYLAATGLDHPMRDAILNNLEADPQNIASDCVAPPADGRPHMYQKHMTHHILPGFDRSWFAAVRHVFLIRHPARVIASYHQKRENPVLEDLGFRQQVEIFESTRNLSPPVVIDSTDIRRAPDHMLRALCDALGLPFDPAMLEWPKGPKSFDGVWAAHWYGAVHRSTGFDAAEGDVPDVPATLAGVLTDALPYYEMLAAFALRPPQ